MSISPNEAQAMLADVDGIVARVKQSKIYASAGGLMMMWGALAALGNLIALVAGRWTGLSWAAIDLAGAAVTFAVMARAPKPYAFPWRYFGSFA